MKRVYPYVVLAVLLAVYILNYLDRQLVSILAEPIKKDLGLSDTQLGLVTGFMFRPVLHRGRGAGGLDGRPRPPGAGGGRRLRPVEPVHRRLRLRPTASPSWPWPGPGSASARAGGRAALLRLPVRLFPAPAAGPGHGALFPRHPDRDLPRRAYGAWAASRWGWRGAFLGLAVPGRPDRARPAPGGARAAPRRAGRGDQAGEGGLPLLASVAEFVRSATLMLVTFGCALSAVVGYSLQSWSPAFLMRVQGAKLSDIGSVYSPLIGLCVAAGIFGSGWVVDRLGQKNPRALSPGPGRRLRPGLPAVSARPAARRTGRPRSCSWPFPRA